MCFAEDKKKCGKKVDLCLAVVFMSLPCSGIAPDPGARISKKPISSVNCSPVKQKERGWQESLAEGMDRVGFFFTLRMYVIGPWQCLKLGLKIEQDRVL